MSFSCTDKDTLVAYVYGECDDATRGAVEAHFATCRACADEAGGFGRVRTALSEWTPPDRVAGFRLVREEPFAAQSPAKLLRPARWWRAPVPALARVAAGVLLFAGGAALANLEVRYDSGGFSVRTGWQKTPPAAREAVNRAEAPATDAARLTSAAPAAAVAAAPEPGPAGAPWRADIASVQRQLRDEFHQQLTAVRAASAGAGPVGVTAAATPDERRVLAYVQAMIDDSAQRQQLWTSYRISQVVGEFQAQRRLDAVPSAITAPPSRPTTNNLFPVTLKK
jgi:anti-sigma factor RsiW